MAIEHVFVLMLENRAFDHMLGFAGLEGTDALNGQATKAVDLINITLRGVANALNLTGTRDMGKTLGLDAPISVRQLIQHLSSNLDSKGTRVFASTPADFKIPSTNEDLVFDPGHEFLNVLMQLCGNGARYPDPSTGKYPPIDMTGFIASYSAGPLPNGPAGSPVPAKIMNCFAPDQLPVLVTLAREFAVCDHWFSSMPGPTWPNRLFMHAASSAGLDDSPSGPDVVSAALIDGFSFNNGTLYDRLSARGLGFTIFEGDEFPQSRGIAGIDDDHFVDFDEFGAQVGDPSFASAYTFIEPNYGNDLPLSPEDFTCGNSQHPLDDVTRGEKLIKTVYETVRNSPHWEKSVLLITYDEHGGFFDHVSPPATAVAPGDGIPDEENNHHNFDFTQLGVRVPAVVVSPLIPRGTIDHTVYDHSSLVATVEALFGLDPLTNRDRQAKTFTHLLSLGTTRMDTLASLPNPADSGFHCEGDAEIGLAVPNRLAPGPEPRPANQPIPPALRGFLRVAFRRRYQLASAVEKPAVIAEFLAIKTKQSALEYMQRVRTKILL